MNAAPNLPGFARPGGKVYLVGIKGTGMSALAELLHRDGVEVSGSDCADKFYTDAILDSLGILYYETFEAGHVPPDAEAVIYSAAYSPEGNPELAEGLRRGLPLLKYPDALGAYSAGFDSSGIAGVHGKTTTTALAGVLARAAGLPASVLAGSAVGAFGGRSTLALGNSSPYTGRRFLIAETCEYRRHFLAFHPRRIVLTSVESDHQDFFPDYESIRDAFVDYIRLLPDGGMLIYCADDAGACEAAALGGKPGVLSVPYGFSAGGDFRIESMETKNERSLVKIACFPEPFSLRVPGRHTAQNAAAALALVSALLAGCTGDSLAAVKKFPNLREGLENFTGSKRRSEILGESGGVLFMDDYGHHPTAIRRTLEGLAEFYPNRRIVASFMSHTYTRTAALLEEFAASFGAAAIVVLHKIYASAREQYSGGVTGRSLYEAMQKKRDGVYYVDEPLEAVPLLQKILRSGDLFITMGAGDNWKLGRALYESYE
jgi:UDP-N-acetylmuramate--alanine ligase